MSNFLIFKAAFNNSATPAIGTYTAEGATASFTQDASLSPDYYLYNPNASITAVQWFVPTKEATDFEFVADILTDDQALGGDRYFSIADSTGATGLCMLSSSGITEWRFMNGDSTATSDPEYVGAIDPATSGGFGVFHQFRIRVRKLTASSSSVEVYVDGTLKLTATAGAALVTCAKIGFIGGVTGSPSTSAGIKNVYVYDLSGGELVDRGVLSGAFNRFISWAKSIFVPRSGGAVITGSALGRTNDTGVLSLMGSSDHNGGAKIDLYGKDRSAYSGCAFIRVADANKNISQMSLYPSGTLVWSGNYLRPDSDNFCKLGAAQFRFSEVYAASGTINTSDVRLKNNIKDIDNKLLDAWGNIEPKQYKFNDATEKKGNKARYHTGYLAQDIQAECEKQGVNASDYGLFCFDEWDEQEEISEEFETEKDGKKVKEKHVIQPKREKGNMYALRYEEALVVECKYLRRCIKQLTARIEQLTTRIEQLEKGKEAEASK